MKTITFNLKSEYFEAIKAGTKTEEFRLYTPYWIKRLLNRSYDEIILCKGYPKINDSERRLRVPWNGFEIRMIQHPLFGDKPVKVFAIKINLKKT